MAANREARARLPATAATAALKASGLAPVFGNEPLLAAAACAAPAPAPPDGRPVGAVWLATAPEPQPPWILVVEVLVLVAPPEVAPPAVVLPLLVAVPELEP